jgi:dimethylargininase
LIRVEPGEEYAANCFEVNGLVLMASGYPRLKSKLSEELDYATVSLDMSEFEKMDGGLSCLSLRW